MSFCSDPTEVDRLRDFDSELLVERQTKIGTTVVKEEHLINTVREHEKLLAFALAMDTISDEEADDPVTRIDKAESAASIAMAVYGSPERYYTDRVKKAMTYDGPICARLLNGDILSVDRNGLVIKTGADVDFRQCVSAAGARTVTYGGRAIENHVARYNEVTAMLVRRNPAVKPHADGERKSIHAELEVRALSALKALAPAKPDKR